MKRLIYGLAILAPLCISNQALAKTKPLNLSYSEIALRYEMFSTELSGTPQDLKGHGTYLALSYDATESIAVNFEYGIGNADTVYNNNNIELDIKHAVSAGASYHTPIYYDTDLIVGASLLRGKTALTINGVPAATADQNGYGINVGIRSLVSRRLELNAGIDQTKIESISDTDFTLGGAYYITKQFATSLHYSVNQDSHSTVISLSVFY